MILFFSLKFQTFRSYLFFMLSFLIVFSCQNLWAAQYAMVTADKAVIYADEQMTSPLGFVRRGKKIKVGEIARNKAQVYPIIISGKMGYIRVLDVNTEKESVESDRLVAERFTKATQPKYRTRYILSYYSYATQISQNVNNAGLEDGDSLNWMGGSLRGEVRTQGKWDFLLIANYMGAKENREEYRAVELGLGAAYRFVEFWGFSLRARAEALGVPFATYAIGSDFRKRSAGFTVGAGLDAHFAFNQNWGLEVSAGMYQTKLSRFDLPGAYKSVYPSFSGTRTSIGISYLY